MSRWNQVGDEDVCIVQEAHRIDVLEASNWQWIHLNTLERAKMQAYHTMRTSAYVEVWTLVGATWHWSDLTFIECLVVELDYGKMSATDLSSFDIAL